MSTLRCVLPKVLRAAVLLLALASPARAQMFTVTIGNDPVIVPPGQVSLRSAVQAANALASLGGPPVTVTINFAVPCPVPPCVVRLEILNAGGMDEDGAVTGDLDMLGPLVHGGALLRVVIDGGADGIIIDAQQIDRIFHVIDAELVLQNVELRSGDAQWPSSSGLVADGGAILAESSGTTTVEVHNSRITSSRAAGNGGGVAMRSGHLIVHNSEFGVLSTAPSAGNVAADSGGAIYVAADARLECHFSILLGNRAGIGRGGGACLESDPSGAPQHHLIVGTMFFANEALMKQGGGLFIGPARTTTVEHCTFGENAAGRGGGMAVQTALTSIRGSQFFGNTAAGEPTLGWVPPWPAPAHASGGGLINLAGLLVTVEDSHFLGNAAVSGHPFDIGGGITNGGSMEIRRTTLEGNTVGLLIGQGDGGGLAHAAGETLVEECRIIGNSALRGGGGIVSIAFGGNGLVVERSEISGNHAFQFGGGIANGTISRISNSTISGNRAGDEPSGTDGRGGGAHNAQLFFPVVSLPRLTLLQCTVADNEALNISAGAGGGIFVEAPSAAADDVTMRGTLLAQNVRHDHVNGVSFLENAGFGPGANPVDDLGFNLDTDGTAALSDPSSQFGTPGIPLNALIGPLAMNGGGTMTHALLPGSPAIDMGSCTGFGGVTLTIDQRGEPRIAPCDVGAYEVAASSCPALQQPWINPPANGYFSDSMCGACAPPLIAQSLTERFQVSGLVTIGSLTIWGGMTGGGSPDDLRLMIEIVGLDPAGLPGPVVHGECHARIVQTIDTNAVLAGQTVWRLELQLEHDVTLAPGDYGVRIVNHPSSVVGTFFIVAGTPDPLNGLGGIAYEQVDNAGNVTQGIAPGLHLAIEVHCGGAFNWCHGDVDSVAGNGCIDLGDLLFVLSEWTQSCSRADLDGDGLVGFGDLIALLTVWGPCPGGVCPAP